MTVAADESLEQWRRFVGGLPAETPLRRIIVESWARSRSAGVDPQSPKLRRVPDAELSRRLDQSWLLRAVARPHLAWIETTFSDLAHVAYLVDTDGIVLESVGTDRKSMKEAGLLPGYDWSEAQMGTNGAGTAIAAGQPVAIVGCEHYCSAWHTATCTGAPIRDEDGRVVGAIDLSTSVEEGRPERLVVVGHIAYAIEKELAARRATERAMAALAEQHRHDEERERLARDAYQAIRAREELVAIASHDVRGPLQAVLLALEAVREMAGDQALVPVIERGRVNVLRAVALLDDLLDATRAAESELELRLSEVDLETLLRECIARHREHVGSARCTVSLKVTGNAVGWWDAMRLDQVFSNLLSNALRYGAGKPIEVHVDADATHARVRVADHGVGIAPENHHRIFDKHDRGGDRSRSGGFGLGLWIAKRIVVALGGRIAVESELGRGATFVVELPLLPAAARSQ